MPNDTIEARARRAAEEIRKNFCAPFRTFSREEHRMLTERRTLDITAIIVREMGEEFDKIKRDRDCMTAIHMCLEGNEAVSRVLNGCYYIHEGGREMTKEELAAKLDGRECGDEITDEEAKEAKKAGLVVVFGASDDLMEFRGIISDELGCYGGCVVHLAGNGLLENECENKNCPHFLRLREKAATINVMWDADGYWWRFHTDIPHAAFDIMDEGEKYCRGIVFALADVKGMEGAP